MILSGPVCPSSMGLGNWKVCQAAGGGQLGSLEDGQLPQDQLGLSTCMSPPAHAANSAL